jgi:hypothetical protein
MWLSTTRLPVLAFAIVLAVTGGMPGWVGADDDNDNSGGKKKPPAPTVSSSRPDLKIEYDGFANPASTQVIRFKVTNLGMARSSAI